MEKEFVKTDKEESLHFEAQIKFTLTGKYPVIVGKYPKLRIEFTDDHLLATRRLKKKE